MSSPEDPSTTSADSVTPAENAMKRQRTDAGDTNVLPGDESQLTASTSSGPITAEGEMPRKKYYRARAHCNPLSHNNAFDYPTMPSFLDWTDVHYPNHPLPKGTSDKVVPTVLDIGCGFGGLTIALATLMGDKTILGLEIRDKVAEYVRLRIAACRKQNPGQYENCSVMRSNTMKNMPNMFEKASLDKMFFCFPDPHFKRKNHPRRIISERLLSEYAYFLKPVTGRLYAITDVEELHQWHLEKCRSHPLFRELTAEEMDADPCVAAMRVETEEGKKVARAGANKYYTVYQRIASDEVEENLISADSFWDEGQFGVRKVKE